MHYVILVTDYQLLKKLIEDKHILMLAA